jgi:hypothetical protein
LWFNAFGLTDLVVALTLFTLHIASVLTLARASRTPLAATRPRTADPAPAGKARQ